MAVLSYFFDGEEGSKPEYGQEEFAEILELLRSRNGVVKGKDDELEVVKTGSAGLYCNVKTGAFWAYGYYMKNTTVDQQPFDDGDATLDRYDRVILRLDRTVGREISIEILKGTPAASPEPPALTRNAQTTEYSLCRVLIEAGYDEDTVLQDSNFIDERSDADVCGYSYGTIASPIAQTSLVAGGETSAPVDITGQTIPLDTTMYYAASTKVYEYDFVTKTKTEKATAAGGATIEVLLGIFNNKLYFKDTSNNIKYFDLSDWTETDTGRDKDLGYSGTGKGFLYGSLYYWTDLTNFYWYDIADGTEGQKTLPTGHELNTATTLFPIEEGRFLYFVWIYGIYQDIVESAIQFRIYDYNTNTTRVAYQESIGQTAPVASKVAGGIMIFCGLSNYSIMHRYFYSYKTGTVMKLGGLVNGYNIYSCNHYWQYNTTIYEWYRRIETSSPDSRMVEYAYSEDSEALPLIINKTKDYAGRRVFIEAGDEWGVALAGAKDETITINVF